MASQNGNVIIAELMNTDKPKDIEEYKKWLEKEHQVEISTRTQNQYESVVAKIRGDFEQSGLWVELTNSLKDFNEQYQIETGGYQLLIPHFRAELHAKPFDSFLSKTYRKNVLTNECWDDPPTGGWLLPCNWYSRINDIVRTRFVGRYFDSLQFMTERIDELCKRHHMPCDIEWEAKEEGYYATHLYMRREFEIPTVTWDTEKVDVSIEIQLTTQVQDVLRKLLHRYYERSRETVAAESSANWRWEYDSDEFVANYLGHILHYVEGMMLGIRERLRRPMQ